MRADELGRHGDVDGEVLDRVLVEIARHRRGVHAASFTQATRSLAMRSRAFSLEASMTCAIMVLIISPAASASFFSNVSSAQASPP